MIQADSLEVLKTIQDFSLTASTLSLIRRIHQLLTKFGHWAIQHIPRDLNKLKNCMANLAFDTSQNLTVFEEIPGKVLVISPIVKASVNLAQ
ncbi:hypothetical protein Goarm_018716, partial [Gossypium armourianum]|nr:hypothetical protein [Gossypium armourianum]